MMNAGIPACFNTALYPALYFNSKLMVFAKALYNNVKIDKAATSVLNGALRNSELNI